MINLDLPDLFNSAGILLNGLGPVVAIAAGVSIGVRLLCWMVNLFAEPPAEPGGPAPDPLADERSVSIPALDYSEIVLSWPTSPQPARRSGAGDYCAHCGGLLAESSIECSHCGAPRRAP